MRLIQLRANKDSFNTISFNEEGISLIAAIQETEDQRNTYNSVGKSLSIILIHFCLGSDPIIGLEKLKDWKFSLDFKIGDEIFTSKRSCNNQKNISLNSKELKLSEFRKVLEKKIFLIPENKKYLSFRGLISRFIRRDKGDYVYYDRFIKNENSITKLTNNSFLLGLDINRVIKKYDLKDGHDKIQLIRQRIEKDPVLQAIFKGEDKKDIDIRIVELEQKVERLSKNLNEFRIAEDYYQIKKEADELSANLKRQKNRASALRSVIRNIELSLDIQPDISKNEIERLYEEANIQLGNLVSRKLEEVENFHAKLLSNRVKRLAEEKRKFEVELEEVNKIIQRIGNQEDEKLQYLNSHGALEEYTQLNKQLADAEKKLDKLKQYKLIVNEYKNKFEEIKQTFSNENIATNKYLEDIEFLLRKNILLFKSFAERFYKDKSAGITIENNERINQKRFEIKAKIEDDAGDAVNEVKIFCFDWTLLKAGHNHNVKFLFHDSRITDGMDSRQVKTLFEVAYEESKIEGYQYIISLNQNVIDSLKKEFSDSDFKKIIRDNIVLQLSDKSDKDKLLGIQIDLNYSE